MLRLARFQGFPATLLKLALLFVVDLVGGLALVQSISIGSNFITAAIILILAAVNYVYLFRTKPHWKFLTPGLIFLASFVVTPIIYTVVMSGFNFTTGNEITKPDAIEALIASGYIEDVNGTAFDVTLGKNDSGEVTALMFNQNTNEIFSIDSTGPTFLEPEEVGFNEWGIPNSAPGFTAYSQKELNKLGDDILEYKFPLGDGSFAVMSFAELAVQLTQDLFYDAETDTITSVSKGITYVDNGNGNFANPDKPNKILFPGWRSANFPENFRELLLDPEVRGPFIGVFVWTIAFAFLSVFTTFIVGLTLALAMDKKIPGRRIYRSILILPYAIPGFLSILIWRGMFDFDFGVINSVLMNMDWISNPVNWFDDPWLARGIVILVNLWLGFPYMYLISSGALQAIPAELKEAAAIDGASAWQSFRLIVLPLLLQILYPLLISSFAFNFNNFNIIYLLTGGGPIDALAGERAGATDILISYAYKTAISNPNDQNFGLASAISLFMFLIVGVLSMWSLRKSKALEEF
jgi:arabinogalactan oligomer/maltooligosaccharide transport system permease protein